MAKNSRRYPAYPLITCDPYFNIWSMDDTLNGDFTRHWTGKQHSMTGIITVDGVPKIFMGRYFHNPCVNISGPKKINQTGVVVTPLKTTYTFADEKIELEVSFISTLIPEDLKLLSRPVSYISYKVNALDGEEHECSVYIDAAALMTVDNPDEEIYIGGTDKSIFAACAEPHILKKSGDDVRINWGYLHLAAKSGKTGKTDDIRKRCAYRGIEYGDMPGGAMKAGIGTNSTEYPVIYHKNDFTVNSGGASDFLCIAYDDIHSAEYFGKTVEAYYKKDGEKFGEVLSDALENYENIMKKVDAFDKKLTADALSVSEDYAALLSIAYRQAVAAHKLVFDGKQGLFLSKECFSGGFAATVDVTYPSIPLFIKYNPDLVEYMLNPIFDFAGSDAWTFDFAPHDAGFYPLVNGQCYGLAAGELQYSCQMPVEECGNMILCVAALCRARNNTDYAVKHFDTLQGWADYLEKNGYNPENQLCTDDFAGHLAHNCNLSVKAIMGLAAWGMLLRMMGKEEKGGEYIEKAKCLAKRWKNDAFDGNCYRLAFDREGTWSIKYNLVWDKLFGLNIFDDDIYKTEVNYYKTQINKYGLPLDSRSDYTKSDWQLWSTVLSDDTEYSDKIISAMLSMLSDTSDRMPFTDWYYSSTAIYRGFQNRTVQGGLFIKLLNF